MKFSSTLTTCGIISLFALLFVFTPSCKNKNANANNSGSDTLSVPSIQFADNRYTTPAGDTIYMDTPFFKSFEGVIEGKQAQIHLYYERDMYPVYELRGVGYIEGSNDFTYSYFFKKIEEEWTNWSESKDNNDTAAVWLTYKAPNTLIAEKAGHTYQLKPAANKYAAFDKLDFAMLYDSVENDHIAYYKHIDYTFIAKPTGDNYLKMLAQIDTIFTINSKEYWSNDVNLEINRVDMEADENYEMISNDYYTPCYLDSALLIIQSNTYVYEGGAHGMYGTTFYNFDVRTGKLIKLEDIITVNNEFTELYIKLLKKEYEEVGFLTEELYVSQNFYILPTGIVFLYNPYEIMSYASGQPTLFLSHEQLAPYLKTWYHNTKSN